MLSNKELLLSRKSVSARAYGARSAFWSRSRIPRRYTAADVLPSLTLLRLGV